MVFDLAQRLVTDDLWMLVEPLLPAFSGRRQGGGTAPLDERRVFTAVVYVLMSRCPWRQLPPWFGVSPATAHRRFATWTKAGLWSRLGERAADPQTPTHERQWATAVARTAQSRVREPEAGPADPAELPGDVVGREGTGAGAALTDAT
jgi:transposase